MLNFSFPMLIFGRSTHLLSCKVWTSNAVSLSFLKFNPDTIAKSDKFPLIIFHGLFGSKNNWKTAGLELAKRTQRTVYAFDVRNHGDSPSVDGTLSDLDAMAGDVMHFVEKNNIEKVSLLGHRFVALNCLSVTNCLIQFRWLYQFAICIQLGKYDIY